MNVSRIFQAMLVPAMAVMILIASGPAQALSPPPPLPVDTLAEFYEAMDGDNWRRNDGWLDPDVPACDWYGITCATAGQPLGGFQWIGYIHLANNNLSGELTEELITRMTGTGHAPVPSRVLDLSGNHITGELTALPLFTPVVKLANVQP